MSTSNNPHNVNFEKKAQCTFCTEPWSNLMLRWGGRVQPCCMNSTSLGDIYTDSFEDIWNGEKIQNIRKLIKEGKYNEAGCNSDCHIIYELSKTKNRSFISEELYEASTKSESFFNNVNKFQQDVLNGNGVVSSSPLTYDIQPTEFCNMACIMCHQNHHNKATIPVDVIDKLFVKKENIYFVRFQGGEVFVDKEFTNYLLKLKKDFSSYQKINVITNGSLVSSDDLDALTSGENTISFIISMDSLNENVYKYIRQNPHFEKVKSTLIHLSNIQKRKNNFDIVVWNFMIMKSNFYEIKLAIEFALKYNIKVYFYPILGNYESENIFKYLNLRPDNCIQYIKEAIDMIELSNTGIISGLDKTLEILSSEVENG